MTRGANGIERREGMMGGRAAAAAAALLCGAGPLGAATPVVLEPPAAAFVPAAPEDHILLAADFETDPAGVGWTAVERPRRGEEPAVLPLDWTEAAARNGARGLAAADGMILSPLLAVEGSTVLRLRFWGRVEPGPDASPSAVPRGRWGLRFYDSRGQVVWENIYAGVFEGGEWMRYGARAMNPEWVRRVQVSFWPEGGTRILVDDVELAVDAAANAFDKETPPPIEYEPEPDRWRNLPNTMAALREGRTLRVLVLGDSIANDLSQSGFERMIEDLYPGARIELTRSVEGSVGWEHFAADDAFATAVEAHRPDLVIVSGMSDRDVVHLHALVRQIRARTEAEPLILNGQVCQTYPLSLLRAPPAGRRMPVGQRERLRSAVIEAGREAGFAVFNLGGVFDQFIYYSEIPMEWWQRDTSHLNPRGKHLIGRMLALFFDPAVQPAPSAPSRSVLREDFETDPAPRGWTGGEGFAGGWDDGDSFTGLRGAQIAGGAYRSPEWPMEPGRRYRVRFVARARSAVAGAVVVLDREGTPAGELPFAVPAAPNWAYLDETFAAPSGAHRARLRFDPSGPGWLLDDVDVEPLDD